jgi:hypothetical protein
MRRNATRRGVGDDRSFSLLFIAFIKTITLTSSDGDAACRLTCDEGRNRLSAARCLHNILAPSALTDRIRPMVTTPMNTNTPYAKNALGSSPPINVAGTIASAVSWSAVLAGAATIAILSLILLILGVGLGLSSVSPWANSGVTAATFGISTIIWLTLTQATASGMGGYIAGRMRVRWQGVTNNEVYFRDTAHGFLAWAVASIATAALMTSVISGILSGTLNAGASVASGVVNATSAGAVTGVAATSGSARNEISAAGSNVVDALRSGVIESLFRSDPNAVSRSPISASTAATTSAPSAEQASAVPIAEVSRIFYRNLRADSIPAADLSYVAQWVSRVTGVAQPDAEKRVAEAFNSVRTAAMDAEIAAKSAADSARKASAKAALWLFVSLLIGAFVASFAAIYGGRERDR